jgi:hypothetical protein
MRLEGRRRACTVIQTTSASSSGGQSQPRVVSAAAPGARTTSPGGGDRHRRRRDRRPALRSLREAHGQHSQQSPAEGEPEQDRRRDRVLAPAREGAGNERERGEEAGEERARDDHRRPASVTRAGAQARA